MSETPNTDGYLDPLYAASCDHCDGTGDDGDLLWPRRCEKCNGTGLVPLCDPPVWLIFEEGE